MALSSDTVLVGDTSQSNVETKLVVTVKVESHSNVRELER
jgi:hypothetical protein